MDGPYTNSDRSMPHSTMRNTMFILYVFLGGFLSILINVNFNRKGVSYSTVLTWDETSDNDWMWILTIRVEKFQICIMMKNA